MFSKSAAAAGVQRITHLQAQHLFEAGVHLFFFNEVAPVRLGDTFAYGGAKARLFA